MLEIGSGWGELAIRAARRGATVTTITLSTAQQALADERIAAAGLSDRVSVELCDYRDVRGEYDAVVSVEMIEAVGWQYWQTYFETIDRVLAPGGKVAIQAITMPHDRMLVTRNTYTWINKYIFPGGFLPSVRVIDEITREHTVAADGRRRSPWGRRTPRRCGSGTRPSSPPSDRVLALGFDPTFLRMWHFYLEYSRAGFASSLPRRQPADLREATRDTPRRSRHRAPLSRRPCAVPQRRPAGPAEGLGRLDGRARRRAPGRAQLRDAVRRLLWHPGELGAAQAYVTGEIDVPGDLDHALTHAFAVAKERGLSGGPPDRVGAARRRPHRSPGSAPSAAHRRSRLAGEASRPAAQPAPRPQRDLLPLRPVQRVLRADPRAADGLLVRLPLLARRLGRAGAVRQAVAGLPQARARARDDPARRRLRLGLAVAARGRALRRPGHRHHDRGRAEEVHRRADQRARPRGPGHDPALRLPRRDRRSTTPSARSRWASTSARTTTRRTPRCCTAR